MTQELNVPPGARVQGIGTGSGYQVMVKAEPGVEVHSIEIIGARCEEGALRAIIGTASPDHVPPPRLAHLGVGGVMFIPVGPAGACQVLWRISRTGEESYESVSLGGGPVRAVHARRNRPEWTGDVGGSWVWLGASQLLGYTDCPTRYDLRDKEHGYERRGQGHRDPQPTSGR